MNVEKERWRAVKGYEGIYSISNFGRVYSRPRKVVYNTGKKVKQAGKLLKSSINKEGYLYVNLTKHSECKQVKVHRLVAIAIIYNPENKPEVNHKDGDKTNSLYSNLEWNTKSENILHAYRIGLFDNHIKNYTDAVKVYKNNKYIDTFISISEASRKLYIARDIISEYIHKGRRVTRGQALGYSFALINQ